MLRSVGCIVLLLFAVLALSPAPPLRADEEMAVETAMFPVLQVEAGEGPVRIVRIGYGADDGVVVGWRGDAYAVRKKDGKSLGIRALGRAEVLSTAAETATVRVTLSGDGPEDEVREGDAVELRVRTPSAPERSVLWRLARSGVTLKTLGGDVLFDYRSLYRGESKETDDGLLDEMVVAIRLVGREYCGEGVFLEEIRTGRYAGRTAEDVIANATREELLTFFRFVLTYPGKYMGRRWNVEEIFATWVINDAPYSREEIVVDVLAAAPADRRARLEARTGLDPDEQAGIVDDLRDRSTERSRARDFEGARDCLAAARVATEVYGREREEARWNRFQEAFILNDEGKTEESNEIYRELCSAFREEPAAPWGEALCRHNLGVGLEATGDYPAALAAYLESIRLKEEVSPDSSSAALTRRVAGDLLRKIGRYTEAIEQYEKAADRFRRLDAREGLNEALTGRAQALEALGRNAEAGAAYRELLLEQRRVGDRAGEADTLDRIGGQSWKLGLYEESLAAHEEALAIYRELGDRAGVALIVDNLGRLLENLGEYGKARERFEEALAMQRERADRHQIATVLADLGKLSGLEGAYDDALARFTEAREVFRAASDRAGLATIEQEIGHLRWQRREFEESLAAYDRAVAGCREIGALAQLSDALRSRGATYSLLKRPAEAKADLEEALRIQREAKAPGAAAEILLDLVNLHRRSLDHDAARAVAKEALGIARATGNRRLEARSLRTLGDVEAGLSRYEEALAAYDGALAVLEASPLPDLREISQTRLARGVAYGNRGDFEGSLAEIRHAIDVAKSCGAKGEVQAATGTLGDVYLLSGRLAKALQTYEDALDLVKNNDWLLADALERLAWCHAELGQGETAIDLQLRVVRLREELKVDAGRALSLGRLAALRVRRGEIGLARQSIREALALGAESLDRNVQATLRTTAGEIEIEAGNVAAGLEHLERALEVLEKTDDRLSLGNTLTQLARARRRAGTAESLVAAARAAERAAGVFAQAGAVLPEGRAREELARIAIDRGEIESALGIAARAVALADRSGSPYRRWESRYVESQALEAAGRLDEALSRRREAMEILQQIRSGLGNDRQAEREFLRSKVSFYESMAELLGNRIETVTDPERKKALTEEALRFIARAHFEILSDDLRDVKDTGSEVSNELLGRIEIARREVARLEKRIEEARVAGNRELAEQLTRVLATNLEELAELHANMTASDPDLGARLKFDPRYLETTDVLPEDARLLVYFTGEDSLFVWVFSRKGFESWRRLPVGRERIGALVDAFRDRMDEVIAKSREAKGRGFGPTAEDSEENPAWYRENVRATREVLNDLDEILIGPVRDQVDAADLLLVLPYGRLNYLPFEALLTEDGSFLGERKRIAYALHSEHLEHVLAGLDRPREKREDVWACWADPVGKLTESLEEAMEIETFFPEHEVHSSVTKTATEGALMELRPDATILHLATHGFLNGTTPSDTWLELASPPGDGKLMQKEIWPRLKREVPAFRQKSVRLVVLSACETARGQDAPEAEVLGLPDAFAMAGVPSVVASLWSVYSWSTTDLMVEFYERLAKEKADLAAAMRDARRELLKDRGNGRYAHPYYWAPFVLYGDWR